MKREEMTHDLCWAGDILYAATGNGTLNFILIIHLFFIRYSAS